MDGGGGCDGGPGAGQSLTVQIYSAEITSVDVARLERPAKQERRSYEAVEGLLLTIFTIDS